MNLQEAARATMQLEQTLQDKYAKLREEAIKKTLFPKKKINTDWLRRASNSMRHVSILASGVAPDVFKSVAIFDAIVPDMTLEQVACLCNSFETVSAAQANMTIEEYCAYQQINKATSETWNTIVTGITNDLKNKYNEELMQKKVVQNSTPLLSKVSQA